ncbi:MAG: DegT/DnrJ/EryC1/StrS family aminotransferase [Oligoflexia bacterium]|nr:DegT/DnrJ/EryC1/StrS family aminotransferase [Oligoflexia bacterium]
MHNQNKCSSGKYGGKELEYLLEFLDHDNPVNKSKKSWSQRFEESFSEKLKVKYSVAVNSGTSGLHAAMYAANIQPGDEVISPALTVIMDAYAIIHVGAKPVFADINPLTLTIDPNDIERKITSKTKAIIVVSLQGLSADMDHIMKIAEKHQLAVIEDSAQTLLGKYKGRMAGTIGHIGIFSFEAKKHITSGSEGGMIVTNHDELAVRARKFSGIGYRHMSAFAGRTSLAISDVQDPNYLRFDTIGLNYRMSEVQAAVGLAQFERVEELLSKRQQVAKFFDEAIEGCQWMVKQETPRNCEHSYYTYAVRYQGTDNLNVSWKEFYDRYKKLGGDGFYGACMIPYLEPSLNDKEINGATFKRGLCPIAESVQQEIMQFKTNYRDMEVAKKKAEILNTLINKLS